MAQKRTVAFCMAVITLLFVIACIPVTAAEKSADPCTENPLPLSLAVPIAERMYFLPPYDEAASFTPTKKLYDLPVSFEIQEVRETSCTFTVIEDCGQATDSYCIESITPRAP